MVARGRKVAVPPEGAIGFADALELASRAIAKASADGGAAARATITAQDEAIKTLAAALESAHNRIVVYEETTKRVLGLYGQTTLENARMSIETNAEKVKLAQVEGDAAFKMEVLRLAGPSLPPAIGTLLLKLGIGTSDVKLLKGDGTAAGNKRAALFRVVMTIVGKDELKKQIVEAVGQEDWNQAIDFLQEMHAQAAAEPPSHQNGAPAN